MWRPTWSVLAESDITVEQSEEQLEINPSDETTAVLKLQADEIVTPLDSVLYADVTPVEIDSAPLLISETLAESVSIEQEMSGMDESLTNASFFDANFLSSVAVEQCRDLSNDNVGPEPERFSSNSSVADETWLTAEGAEQVDTEKLMAELCSLGRIADPEDSEENECQSHGRKSAEISIEPSLKNFGHSQVDTHFSPAPYCPAVDDLSPFADETIQTTEKHETLSETENLDESQSIVQPTNANPINDTGSTDISFEQKIKEFEFAEISLKLVELCGLVDEPTLSNLSSAQLCEILIQFNRCSETILEVLKKKSA